MPPSNDSRQGALTEELEAALNLESDHGQTNKSGLYPAIVAGKSGTDLVVELGPRVQGVVSLDEFDEMPENGSELKVALRGREDGLWLFSVKEARALAAWDEMELGSLVKGTVVGLNKGGLELKVGSINAFMPASQVALSHVDDLASFAGQTMVCEVLEIDRDKRRVVLSRRAVLEEERSQQREQSMGRIEVGSVLRGKVSRIESFGAFVEIAPSIEGLLHVSNISHKRVDDPNTALKKGQDVEVQVIKIEEGGRRIGLSMKALEADPWDALLDKHHEDSIVEGTVRRLADYGAFVEIEPGIDGLLHVSQLGEGRVQHSKDVLKVGEKLSVRILNIDAVARRISLSRLDPHGAILGSEEAAGGEEIRQALDQAPPTIGTNLGSLFKKALDNK